MQEYEKEFDPSRYTERKQREKKPDAVTPGQPEEPARSEQPVYIDRTEKVIGYRLQVYSTTSIDDASNRKEFLRSVLDSAHIDLVFDAPYYKLRVGHFLDRAQAETYRTELQSRGINDAWIVRDQVLTTRKEQVK